MVNISQQPRLTETPKFHQYPKNAACGGPLSLPWDSLDSSSHCRAPGTSAGDPQTQHNSSALPLATSLRDSLKAPATALGIVLDTTTPPSITRARSRTPCPSLAPGTHHETLSGIPPPPRFLNHAVPGPHELVAGREPPPAMHCLKGPEVERQVLDTVRAAVVKVHARGYLGPRAAGQGPGPDRAPRAARPSHPGSTPDQSPGPRALRPPPWAAPRDYISRRALGRRRGTSASAALRSVSASGLA